MRAVMEVTLLDMTIRKVLEEKLSTEFVKRFLTIMVNPEKLTFPTLVLIYETYGRLEGFTYPDWFWDKYFEDSDSSCNCSDEDDNPMDLAAEAMGFRKVRIYYAEYDYSTDEYIEDSDF